MGTTTYYYSNGSKVQSNGSLTLPAGCTSVSAIVCGGGGGGSGCCRGYGANYDRPVFPDRSDYYDSDGGGGGSGQISTGTINATSSKTLSSVQWWIGAGGNGSPYDGSGDGGSSAGGNGATSSFAVYSNKGTDWVTGYGGQGGRGAVVDNWGLNRSDGRGGWGGSHWNGSDYDGDTHGGTSTDGVTGGSGGGLPKVEYNGLTASAVSGGAFGKGYTGGAGSYGTGGGGGKGYDDSTNDDGGNGGTGWVIFKYDVTTHTVSATYPSDYFVVTGTGTYYQWDDVTVNIRIKTTSDSGINHYGDDFTFKINNGNTVYTYNHNTHAVTPSIPSFSWSDNTEDRSITITVLNGHTSSPGEFMDTNNNWYVYDSNTKYLTVSTTVPGSVLDPGTGNTIGNIMSSIVTNDTYRDYVKIIYADDIIKIGSGQVESNDPARSIHIGRNVTDVTGCMNGGTNLTEYTVDANNAKYRSADGYLIIKQAYQTVIQDVATTTDSILKCPHGASGAKSIPAGIKSICDSAFVDTLITEINLNEVTLVGHACFRNITRLKSIHNDTPMANTANLTIGNSNITLHNFCFAGTGIQALRLLPAAQGSTGQICMRSGCFTQCNSLTSIHASIRYNLAGGGGNLTSAPFANNNISDIHLINDVGNNAVTYSYGETVSTGYYKYTPWNTVSGTAPTVTVTFENSNQNWSIKSTGSYAFASSKNIILKLVGSIPKNVGDYAFWNANIYADTPGTIPFSIESSIGRYGFAGSIITTIDFSDRTTPMDIHDFAFSGCTSLESIDLGNNDNVHYYLGKGVFEGCTSLTSGAFHPNLHSLTLSGSTAVHNETLAIPERMYKDCTKITSINLPSTISVIMSAAFQNCSGLTSVDIPSKVIDIRDYAFYNTSIRFIILPESVQNVGTYSLYIPESVLVKIQRQGGIEGSSAATNSTVFKKSYEVMYL